MNSLPATPASDKHLAIMRELHAVAAPETPLHQRLQSEFPYEIRSLIIERIQRILASNGASPVQVPAPERSDLTTEHGGGNGYHPPIQLNELDDYVRKMRLEIATDEVLSTPQNFISHYGCLAPLIAHELEQVASGEVAPEYLDSVGSIFIDVNGMKTIVDCTSHAHACAFLQRIALILRNPSDVVLAFLKNNNLTMEAYTVGGDEFFLLVRGRGVPVTHDLLDALAGNIEQLIAEDPALNAHISLDDDSFLWRYAGLDEATLKRIDDDPAYAESKRKEIGDTLPKKFSPSVSTGTATLREGLDRAVSDRRGNRKRAMTFEQFAYSAHYATFDLADERQKQNKDRTKVELRKSDPKQYEFLMRNAENRRLRRLILELREQVEALMGTIQILEFENAELRRKLQLFEEANATPYGRSQGRTSREAS